MPTTSNDGTNYALKANPKVGTWPNAAACNGEVYVLSEECYSTGTGSLGSLMYMGKLPVGAIVLFSVVWPIDSTNPELGGEGMGNAVAGELGTATDPDLFGDIAQLDTTTLPQILEPKPDSSIYTTTLDFALREETTVIFKTTAAFELADTEGIALKMFYTMAGKTY